MTAHPAGPSPAPSPAPSQRVWRPGRPVDPQTIWGVLRRGAGDPAWRTAGGALWRAVRTPDGAVTLRTQTRRADGTVLATAWGPGAGWVLDRLPTMLGEEDAGATEFEPGHRLLVEARRRHPGWRVPRTGLVLESLVPAVLEQKVTGQEAFGCWGRIVQRFGEPAPGPGAPLGLVVPPGPEVLRQIPSWEWLRAGVGPQRSDTVQRVAGLARRLEEVVDLEPALARRRLTSVVGVGVWTAAETAHRALGDADAVSFGDYHVAADIGWALTGHPVGDAALVELLRPWAGHRYRVQRYLQLVGARRPRRGPRMAPRRHLPVATR